MKKVILFIGVVLLTFVLAGCSEVIKTEDFEVRGMINIYKVGENELITTAPCFSGDELVGLDIKGPDGIYSPFYFAKQDAKFKEFIGKKAIIRGKIIYTTYPCGLFENCNGMSCSFAEVEEITLLENPICDLPFGGLVINNMEICDLNGETVYAPDFKKDVLMEGQSYYYLNGETFLCGGIKNPDNQDSRCEMLVCNGDEISCEV